MAIYRPIQVSFWHDNFVINLTPEEKFFYLYLMTNEKTTQCGIYEIPLRIIEMDTGYNRETVTKLLERFTEYEKIKYNFETGELMILNWVKHNKPDSRNIITCIEKELKLVKDNSFKECFYSLCKEYGYAIDTPNKPLDSPSQTPCKKEKEKEKEKEEEYKKEKEIDKEKNSSQESTLPKEKKHKKTAPPKSSYGEYGNVLLTDDEYSKLLTEIPNAADGIEKLSEYMASTGKKYASHYATIRAWHRKDLERERGKPSGTGSANSSAVEEFMKEVQARDGSTGFC